MNNENFICDSRYFFVLLPYQIKTIEEMTNYMKHYEAGIDIRTKLTTHSVVQIKSMLDKVFQIVEDDYKIEEGIAYYKEATLNIKYGSERCNEKNLTIGFILKEATMSWGHYDMWHIILDPLGIRVEFKPEHGNTEIIQQYKWGDFIMLNELLNTI